ncbi:MAG: hypothetical protein V3V15_10500 [Sphingorhabdus sp.]
MPIAVITCFLLGIANFAMHKAVIDSNHPFVEDTKLYFGRYFGKSGSYVFEFALLLGALVFASLGSMLIVFFYVIYSGLNMLAAWLLLSGRV